MFVFAQFICVCVCVCVYVYALAAPSVPLNVVSGAAFPVWTLTWQPPSVVGDDFVSYRITLERMCLSPLPAVVTNDTSYMISMLQEGIHYTLILEAFNSAGPSPELKYTFFQSRSET